MDELRVEVGVKERFQKKLVRSRLKYGGHVENTGEEQLAQRADAQKMGEKIRRGRPRMRWEDWMEEIWRDREQSGENNKI